VGADSRKGEAVFLKKKPGHHPGILNLTHYSAKTIRDIEESPIIQAL